jgi:hypothetical protein
MILHVHLLVLWVILVLASIGTLDLILCTGNITRFFRDHWSEFFSERRLEREEPPSDTEDGSLDLPEERTWEDLTGY